MQTGRTLWGPEGPGFSSKSDDWATPARLFAALDAEFGFELDVCASANNAKCSRYFTVADDGLAEKWTGCCWMNPPYARRVLERWVEKAADSADAGATVVALIPARTDTVWWHEQVMARAAEVRFIKGRLKFGSGDAPAPFPSALVVYRPGRSGAPLFSGVTRDNPTPTRTREAAGRKAPRLVCPRCGSAALFEEAHGQRRASVTYYADGSFDVLDGDWETDEWANECEVCGSPLRYDELVVESG
jgi:phage N-6-adenine-methyltransferase